MKTAEEILNEYGCPEISFDEKVTMYYPAIINAMEEYTSQSQPTDSEIDKAATDWVTKSNKITDRDVILCKAYISGAIAFRDKKIPTK